MRELSPWCPLCGLAALTAVSNAYALTDLNIATSLEGIGDDALRKEIQHIGRISKGETSYTALAPLRRAARDDVLSMQRALISMGYYAAEVKSEIARTGLDVQVTYQVALGEKFEITGYRIDYQDVRLSTRPTEFIDAGIKTRGNPSAERLEELENAFIQHLWNIGYPGAEGVRHEVRANFDTSSAEAIFLITSGPLATYGQIEVSGTDKTAPDHIRAYFEPAAGSTYRRAEIDSYRAALAETGLFREVSIQPAAPQDDGTTNLLIDVQERKSRTIGAGISFGTDVGVGATASWENRNLFGQGERLTTELTWSSPTQDLDIAFEDPLPRLPGSWTASLLLENETTDAFEAQSVTIGTGLRKLLDNRRLELSAVTRYTYSQITDFSDANFPEGIEENAQTISFPLAAVYSNEDDRLNPTRGLRLTAEVTPYIGDLRFNRLELTGATRQGFGPQKRFILASRARIGATLGASGTDLPATERFYAGGGGSIRGYAFQEAGPIDMVLGNPTGGASVAELNIEARYQVRPKYQIALFADGGSVYDSETPDFSGDFLVGAGIGLRYLTAIGPLRLDIATPLDQRELIALVETGPGIFEEQTIFEDDPIQVYIALGQPF